MTQQRSLSLHNLIDKNSLVKKIPVIKPGVENTISLEIKKLKAYDYLKKLEILSLIDVFDGLTLKNLRDLIDISNEE